MKFELLSRPMAAWLSKFNFQNSKLNLSLICLVPVVKTITFGGYGAGVHLFPFRTEKLSPASPMILHLFVEK